jgi:hypothetical protein
MASAPFLLESIIESGRMFAQQERLGDLNVEKMADEAFAEKEM